MNEEDKGMFKEMKLYIHLYFFSLLLFGVILAWVIMYSFPSPMEFSCPSCDKVYACQEFKEDVRLIYNINKTSLKSMCSSVCKVETIKYPEDYGQCFDYCVDEEKMQNLNKYISGNETYFRCIK